MNSGAITALFLAGVWFAIGVGFVVGCIRNRFKAENLMIDAKYGLTENPPTPTWRPLIVVSVCFSLISLTFYLTGLYQLVNG